MTPSSPAHRSLFFRSFRWLSLLALLAVLSPLTASSAPAAHAAPAALPGGKSTFVVAAAKLHDGKKYNNWTQLGWYLFDASRHQVRAETFVWRQDAPVKELRREEAGTLPDARCSGAPGKMRRCQVMTAPRYSAASSSRPPVVRTGSYLLRAKDGTAYLDIRWPRGVTETWSVHPMPGLARLDWVASNNSTHGYAYGSNAPISERREMDTVKKHQPLPYKKIEWSKDRVSMESWQGPFDPSRYGRCKTTSWCMTYFQPTSGACKCAKAGSVTSLQYYLARVSSKDRRDTWWHWCTCLSPREGTCYTGNSHIKPLLQIIDDDHRFRGYVGAEASFNPYNRIDRDGHSPRWHDMLGVFRFADPGPGR
ncbi:hypothetical protein [Streptomyces dioscori]|uniref:hypothetical protein n=1 Tax=Streptomyces dioscori TaxID=2109333 RepID=UPI00131D4648|nr:hypothetical protein [Streptomyces dioscori]